MLLWLQGYVNTEHGLSGGDIFRGRLCDAGALSGIPNTSLSTFNDLGKYRTLPLLDISMNPLPFIAHC